VPSTGDPFVPVNTRTFLAGLMAWVDTSMPTADSIAGCRVVDDGIVHVKAILTTGGQVLGCRELDTASQLLGEKVTHRAGGPVYVYRGATRVRRATVEEAATLPVMSTWGYSAIAVRAEREFAGH
jgi:hypothetical protein